MCYQRISSFLEDKLLFDLFSEATLSVFESLDGRFAFPADGGAFPYSDEHDGHRRYNQTG
jgi:hypothetical protein